MAVTAKDVAEACGVSRITVNRALSGNENVKPETREKILKKAQEMGYVPNLIARSLVNGKSKMIGIVISDIKKFVFLRDCRCYNTSGESTRIYGLYLYA